MARFLPFWNGAAAEPRKAELVSSIWRLQANICRSRKSSSKKYIKGLFYFYRGCLSLLTMTFLQMPLNKNAGSCQATINFARPITRKKSRPHSTPPLKQLVAVCKFKVGNFYVFARLTCPKLISSRKQNQSFI